MPFYVGISAIGFTGLVNMTTDQKISRYILLLINSSGLLKQCVMIFFSTLTEYYYNYFSLFTLYKYIHFSIRE